MKFDLQVFAETKTTTVKMEVFKDGDVLNLGNTNKVDYKYSAENDISATATSHLGFGFNGEGIGLNMINASGGDIPAANSLFYLNTLKTSISAGESGNATYDELHLMNNITSFGFDVDTTDLKAVDFGEYAGVVSVTSAATDGLSVTAKGNKTEGNQALVFNNTKEIVVNSTKDATIASGSFFTLKNDKETVNLMGGTSLSGIDVSAAKTSDIKFTVLGGETATLNFGKDTTGAKVSFGGNAALNSKLDNAKGVVFDMGKNTSAVTFDNIVASEVSITSGIKGANLNFVSADTDSSVFITSTSDMTLSLSGKGIETLSVDYLKTTNITVANWKLANGDASVKASAIDMGTLSLQSVTGAFENNALKLNFGSSKVVIERDESGNQIENVAGVRLENNDNSYDALIVGGGALQAKQGLNLKGFDAFLGTTNNNTLDLGDVTDKEVVYLNNSIGGSSWGEWAIYNNITNVKTSTAGRTLLVSDMADKQTSLYGAGADDSLFSGVGGTASDSMVDSLGSARGKRGWFGSSDYSGHDVIIIRDETNKETYNFDYSDQVASDQEADVLALMHGAGYIEFDSGTNGTSSSVNFSIGSDSVNYMEFRNIDGASNSNNSHDFFYTYDLGATTFKARVDLTNGSVKGNINYDSDIQFYLGQGDTTLTLKATDANQKLNYDGGGVMMNVANIDGSRGGANNILNGQADYEQSITAASRYATTICGGYNGGYVDTGDDVLIGGKDTTFLVGANMGDDRIQNVDSGDTVVFLGSKWSDVTSFNSDVDRVTVTFNNESGGAKIRMETASDSSYQKVSDFTCEFDDCVWTWNGSNWTQTVK